jgi:hypothetical protein
MPATDVNPRTKPNSDSAPRVRYWRPAGSPHVEVLERRDTPAFRGYSSLYAFAFQAASVPTRLHYRGRLHDVPPGAIMLCEPGETFGFADPLLALSTRIVGHTGSATTTGLLTQHEPFGASDRGTGDIPAAATSARARRASDALECASQAASAWRIDGSPARPAGNGRTGDIPATATAATGRSARWRSARWRSARWRSARRRSARPPALTYRTALPELIEQHSTRARDQRARSSLTNGNGAG